MICEGGRDLPQLLDRDATLLHAGLQVEEAVLEPRVNVY